jgi:PAS domain S-box-containing protein
MPSLSDGTPDCGSKRPQADIRRTLEMIPTLAWAASEDGSVDFLNRKWLEYTGLTLEEALGWGWKIGFHPDDQERVECRWREIVASRAPGELEARVCRHDGAFRWFMIRATPGRDKDGTVFEWFCTYTDIDTRKSAEILLVRTTEALRASEHLAKGQLKMLTRTLTVMAQETDPDRLLEHVLATIGGQLGSHSIAVCEYREGTIVRIADCGKGHLHFLTPNEIDAAPRQPVATIFHPIWSNFFQHGAHCVLAEIDVNPRLRLAGVPNAPTYDSWQSPGEIPLAYRAAMEKLRADGVVASLAVPLFIEGRVTGFLNIRFEKTREFSLDELALTQALAHQATLALQLLRLSRQSRETAVEAERNRMARDVHDTLAQGFTGVIIQLDSAKRAMKRRNLTKAAERVGRAEDLARVGLGEARRSVLALRSRTLEALSVGNALEDLFTRMTSGSGLRSRVDVIGAEPSLSSEWKEILVRVAQESLTNTIKHAHARTFKATLRASTDELQLDLVDDGSGFNPKKRHDGFGLQGMKERIDRIGGQFIVSSAKGAGTRIRIILNKGKDSENPQKTGDV